MTNDNVDAESQINSNTQPCINCRPEIRRLTEKADAYKLLNDQLRKEIDELNTNCSILEERVREDSEKAFAIRKGTELITDILTRPFLQDLSRTSSTEEFLNLRRNVFLGRDMRTAGFYPSDFLVEEHVGILIESTNKHMMHLIDRIRDDIQGMAKANEDTQFLRNRLRETQAHIEAQIDTIEGLNTTIMENRHIVAEQQEIIAKLQNDLARIARRP